MKIIIGKKAGFCEGIKIAIEKAEKTINNNQGEIMYCLGDLVHNPIIMKNLYQKGLKVINNLSEIENPNNKTVIIRAHGVIKSVYEQAKNLGIKLVDLTCPNVLAIHKLVEEYSQKGYYILVMGEKQHAETIGTASFCGENYEIIEEEEQLKNIIKYINNKKIEKIFIIAQTTFNLDKFNKFINIIQKDVNAEIIIKNTICNATQIRQEETIELSKKVNYMIIIGGRKSSNTNKLYDISCNNCKKVIMIEDVQELTKEHIEEIVNSDIVGIMAGASTPQKCIEEVKERLENAVVNIS